MSKYPESPERTALSKLGKYHGSYFWNVPGFGRETWVILIGVNVKLDKRRTANESYCEELAPQCVAWLNENQRDACGIKKLKRKSKKPLVQPLGELGLLRSAFVTKGDETYISLVMTTTVRKSKYLWSEGQKVPRIIKLGRPKKK